MSSSVIISESNRDEDCCPICLRSIVETSRVNDNRTSSDCGSLEFVYSRSCGHMFCLACMQQLLLAPSSSNRTAGGDVYLRHDDTTSPVASVVTTTQGICPMCRADISYFELFSCYFEEGSITKTENFAFVSDPVPDVLCNSVFSKGQQMTGPWFQVSFPSTFEINGESVVIETSSSVSIPLMRFHYLSATHTLFLMGNGTVHPAGDYEVGVRAWFTFSDNFQFITHGVVCFTDILQSSAGVNTTPADRDVQAVYQFALGGNADSLVRLPSEGTAQNDDIPRVPSYNKLSLWGNVFCQSFKVGLASYHFLPADPGNNDGLTLGDAYISYEHPRSAEWPLLDNGRPIPSRVKFSNVSCPDPHTFCASVCWLQDYNTTWKGASRWDYKMEFDSEFMGIISGTAKCVAIHEDTDNTARNETIIDASSYGTELRYINAALFDEFRKTYTNDMNAQSSTLDAAIDRLEREGAPHRFLGDISLLRGAVESAARGENGNSFNPIDLRYFYS